MNVRKVQVAILARLPREMSQTDRILPRYILSRVRVSFWPRFFYTQKNRKPQSPGTPQSITALRQINNSIGTDITHSAELLSTKSLSAKTLLRSQAIRVQTPCREQYFFSFLLFAINGLLLINPRNIIGNIIMIFNIHSTRGQTRFLTCVARVTCLVYLILTLYDMG